MVFTNCVPQSCALTPPSVDADGAGMDAAGTVPDSLLASSVLDGVSTAKQPSAAPDASTPRGALPALQLAPSAASALAVPALPEIEPLMVELKVLLPAMVSLPVLCTTAESAALALSAVCRSV